MFPDRGGRAVVGKPPDKMAYWNWVYLPDAFLNVFRQKALIRWSERLFRWLTPELSDERNAARELQL